MTRFKISGNLVVIIGIILSLYGGIRIDKHNDIVISAILILMGFSMIIIGLIVKNKK